MYAQQVKATDVSETPQTLCTKLHFTLWKPRLHIEIKKPKGTRNQQKKISEDLRDTEVGVDPGDALKS